jgi:hypothetical protein
LGGGIQDASVLIEKEGGMHVVAIHDVKSPDRFWEIVQTSEIPAGITLLQSYPNPDGTRAACLWEASSVDALRDFVDGAAGDTASNEFFEVNASNALGLPGS